MPTLPTVFGWAQCQGDERSLFNCPMSDAITVEHTYNPPSDFNCATHGCVGADGIQGTLDDSIDDGTACSHAVDQGAICYSETDAPDQLNVEKCGGARTVSWYWNDHGDQAIAFGCIHYYTTQCTFDATNTALNTRDNVGTYMWAMRAFARCSEVVPAAPGYCHGAIASAAALANHEVCKDGSTTNIGFRTRPCAGLLRCSQSDLALRRQTSACRSLWT